MKRNNIKSLLLLTCFLFISGVSMANPPKKAKVRMSVQYVKVMNDHSYLKIDTKAKGENGFHPVNQLELSIFTMVSDSSILLGKVSTNMHGSALFNLNVSELADTLFHFVFLIKSATTDEYKAGKKKIEVDDINLSAKTIVNDSLNYISARLTSPLTSEPVSDVYLQVRVKRTFNPLVIGEDSYLTDDDGAILVPVDAGIPGIDGVLSFEVVINDNDQYGTVINSFDAPIGVPIVTTDTFDDRTMWSPPSKTPIYVLLWPNLILLGIWLTLFALMFNLYRISKSKN